MEVLPALEREELRASGERALAIVEASEELGISDRLAAHLLESPDLSATQVDVKESLQRKIGDIPSSRNFASVIGDTLQEALTFGGAETRTFNWESLNRKYDAAREEVGSAFEQAAAEAVAEGKEIAETKTEYLDRVLPSRGEFVQTILDAQPALAEIAREVGLASIPIYGTVRTWEDSPNWARALGVASDLVFLVPVIGQSAAASRAGISFVGTAKQLAIAEITAPITMLRHPIRTLKAALDPIETLLSPRKIPIEALEIRTGTIRIPASPRAAAALPKQKRPHLVEIPEAITEGVTTREVMSVRDVLTDQAIRGEAPVAMLSGGIVTTQAPALQRITTRAAAVHNTPDLRNWFFGGTIREGERLYLAPGRMEQYVQRTAKGLTELPLGEKARNAVLLGEMSDTPIKGALIITDPELLLTLEGSGKLWRHAAEIEKVLPAGTVVPPPSQVLHTRSVTTGEKTTILVVGKPFTPLEIAKLKLVGTLESIRQIVSPRPGSFVGGTVRSRPRSTVIYNDPRRGIMLVRGRGESDFIFPGGGTEGLSATQAAIRELQEETGLTITSSNLRKLGGFDGLGDPSDWKGRPLKHTIFEASDVRGVPKPSHEIAEIRYWKPGSSLPVSKDTAAILSTYTESLKSSTALRQRVQSLRSAGNVSEARALEVSIEEASAFIPDPEDAARSFARAGELYEEAALAESVGDIDRARSLEMEGDSYTTAGRYALYRSASIVPPDMSPVAVYTGDQDIVEAFRSMGAEVSAEVEVPRTSLDNERVPFERSLVAGAGELVGRVPVPEVGELRGVALEDDLVLRAEVDSLDGEVEVFTPKVEDVLPPRGDVEVPPPGRGRVPPLDVSGRPDLPRRVFTPPPPTRVITAAGDPGRGRVWLPGGGDRRPGAQELRERASGVTWQQGRVWIALYPPYTEDDILISPYRQPINTERVNGPKKAWDTIKGQGYEIDYETYDEWAAWFAPKGVEISARLSPSVSISPTVSVGYPTEAGGMPLATRRAFWWHID